MAQLPASVASVLQLVASDGLNGASEIRCKIKGRIVDAKATITIGSHSASGSYSTWIKHLEIEFDDTYIDNLVSSKVAAIFAKLAGDACRPSNETP